MKKLVLLGVLAVVAGYVVKTYPNEVNKVVDLAEAEVDKQIAKVRELLKTRV